MKKIIVVFITCCSFLFANAQNVGIGTTTLAEKLQVAGKWQSG